MEQNGQKMSGRVIEIYQFAENLNLGNRKFSMGVLRPYTYPITSVKFEFPNLHEVRCVFMPVGDFQEN